MTTYIGLAIADSMFPPGIFRKDLLTPNQVQAIIQQGVVSCVNPAHRPTVDALHQRFAIELPVPAKPVKVNLDAGDRIVVCTVLGLPRETREFTDEEIDRATFDFSLWTVESN